MQISSGKVAQKHTDISDKHFEPTKAKEVKHHTNAILQGFTPLGSNIYENYNHQTYHVTYNAIEGVNPFKQNEFSYASAKTEKGKLAVFRKALDWVWKLHRAWNSMSERNPPSEERKLFKVYYEETQPECEKIAAELEGASTSSPPTAQMNLHTIV